MIVDTPSWSKKRWSTAHRPATPSSSGTPASRTNEQPPTWFVGRHLLAREQIRVLGEELLQHLLEFVGLFLHRRQLSGAGEHVDPSTPVLPSRCGAAVIGLSLSRRSTLAGYWAARIGGVPKPLSARGNLAGSVRGHVELSRCRERDRVVRCGVGCWGRRSDLSLEAVAGHLDLADQLRCPPPTPAHGEPARAAASACRVR